MSNADLIAAAEQIQTLLLGRMHIKSPTLEGQIHKAGRRLPRGIKKDARRVALAHQQALHPKLSRQIDYPAVENAADRVIEHLEAINPNDAIKDRILWGLGKISAVLIIAFIIAVWAAHSRGLI